MSEVHTKEEHWWLLRRTLHMWLPVVSANHTNCRRWQDTIPGCLSELVFYFFCLYSCSFWLRYGILTNEQSIVMVNIIGATLFLIYTLVYYVFTVNKRSYVKQFAVVLTLLIGVVVFTNNLQDEPQKMIHITGELELVPVSISGSNWFIN